MEPQENQMPPFPTEQKNERAVGPTVGIIVIILIVLLGGLYFWGERAEKREMNEALDALQTEADEMRAEDTMPSAEEMPSSTGSDMEVSGSIEIDTRPEAPDAQ